MAIKAALLCQFKDPEEYFASFHAHHARIFDWIFYIDHGSKKDYRTINLKNTQIYRTDIRNFTKDLFHSRVIQDIRKDFDLDFLFILDIDEFLPQTKKSSFHDFLDGYLASAVGTLFWKNGCPLNMARLSDGPPILAQKKPGSTKKLFYNLRRLGCFFPKEGNHNAEYSFLGQTRVQIRPRRNKEPQDLIHLPIISKAQLDQKLHEFPDDDFRAKIEIPHDCDVFDLPFDVALNVVANYRSEESMHYDMQDFETISILEDLVSEMHHIDDKIRDLTYRKAPVLEEFTPNEIANLRRRGFGRVRKLLGQLNISDDKLLRKGEAT